MPDIQTVMNEALNSHTSGRLDDAERLYKQALAIDSQISDAVHLLGVIALARGDARKAAKTIQRAIKMRGDYPAYHGNLAVTYLNLGKFKEAAKSAHKAIKLDPVDSSFHCSLGSALDGLGKLPEAEVAFCRALEIDPANGAALNNLGTICMRGGDFGRSVDLFTRLPGAGTGRSGGIEPESRRLYRTGQARRRREGFGSGVSYGSGFNYRAENQGET